MALNLLIAKVSHARQRPKRNAFSYGVYYLCFALSELAQIKKSLLPIFSFHERDHGAMDGTPLEPWIRHILEQRNIPEANGDIILLTLPRLFGYVFNPVSFWFCLDSQGELRAVLSEVTNTFGDRHCYLSAHEDRRPIAPDDQIRAEKLLHVSPFIDVTGYYLFRFIYRGAKIGVWIDHYNDEGLLITTALTGKREMLSAANQLRCFFRYPLVTLKVIGLIHYQALWLWFKGTGYRPRPKPPTKEIS
jgi:DUF1365 family protein